MISSAIQALLPRATVEIETKSLHLIQTETARLWAARMCACAQKALVTEREKNLAKAIEFAHEALEHAALTGDRILQDEVEDAARACGLSLWDL